MFWREETRSRTELHMIEAGGGSGREGGATDLHVEMNASEEKGGTKRCRLRLWSGGMFC